MESGTDDYKVRFVLVQFKIIAGQRPVRFDSGITHVYIPYILSLIKSTVLKCGPLLIS